MNELEKEIQQYLAGKMNPEEKADLERKINADPNLQEDLKTYLEMNDIYDQKSWKLIDPKTRNTKVQKYEDFLNSDKGKNIEASISNVEAQYFTTKKYVRTRHLFYYASAIAASFVIIFFAFSLLKDAPDNKALYAEYKNWSELPSLSLRDEASNLSNAEKFFKAEEYEKALSIFESIKSKNGPVLIYKGVSELELNKYKSAEETFKALLESNSLDKQKANWYLALTYLKIDNKQKAIDALKEVIKTSGNPNYQKAIELLEILE